jgi:heavy metal sensor kinase
VRSIRWSLQLWHAGLLAVVVAGFGFVTYYDLRVARFQKIDRELERSAQMLASSLRFPRPRFGPDFNDRGPPPPRERPPDYRDGPSPSPAMQDDGPGQGPPDRPPGPDQRDGPFGRGGRRGPGGRGGRNDFGGRGGPGGGPDPQLTEIEVPVSIANRYGNGDVADPRDPSDPDAPYYVVWDYDRGVVKTSRKNQDVPDPAGRPAIVQGPPPNPAFIAAQAVSIRQRGDFREAYLNGPAGSRVLVGRSIRPDESELARIAWLLAGTGATLLVIGLAGGWVLSFRAIRPIRAITAAAQEISASNLSRRIDTADTDSELGTLAAVLNDAFARLESTFQQQVRFTADASHELRTPLAVIHTHTQLALSRERSPEEYRKTLETCLRASTRMKGLVDSLLVLAKADAGRLTLDRQHVDLATIVEDSLTMVMPLGEERGITLVPDLQPAKVYADPGRISQVVINLLTNAIRYNREQGSVRISVRSDGASALLAIADTGVGIPTASQAHLFERFYRVDEARSREQGGSGLGLAICKSIVEAHGGTIGFESQEGVGTTFTVRLPGEQFSTSEK